MAMPPDEKDFSMNLRNVLKPLATVLLTVGLLTIGVAGPADAGTTHPAQTTLDTGWGRK